jgi:hypothetical protein
MLTSASPLLDDRDVTNLFIQRSLASAKRSSSSVRSRNGWTWISVASLILNTTILLGLLYGVGICVATIRKTLVPANEYCLNSVSVSYNYITFSGEGYNTYYGPKCLNPLRTISTYASGKTFCTEKEIEIGFEKIRKDCEKDELEFLDWRHLVANITNDDITKMRIVDFDEIPTGNNVTKSVRISESFFQRVDDTLVRLPQSLSSSSQLTFTDGLGVRSELAPPVRLRPLWVLGCSSGRVGNRSYTQD